MAMKNDTKIEEELTCGFKIDMRNFTIFYPSTLKSNLIKVYNVWAKKSAEELCLMALNVDAKFEGKVTCVFSKMTWVIWQICIGWNKWIANVTKLFTHV